MSSTVPEDAPSSSVIAGRDARPRVGFLGVGWIGRSRMEALAASGVVEPAAIADLDPVLRAEAVTAVPGAEPVHSLEGLLDPDLALDAVVIATPSALHADQAVAALEAGLAVFCQKPLGRDAAETKRVVDAARAADRLLSVDLSYRHTAAVQAAAELVASGELGRIYAADLVFHNAYGPDKAWFTQRALSGGGCLVDLGTHLVDLVLWLTGSRSARVASARLLHGGGPLASGTDEVEDFALAQLELDTDLTARVACSWFLPAGRECRLECTLFGTEGAVSVTNVDGSFYDFRADRHQGTTTQPLFVGPDEWGGRAITAWGARLAQDPRFDAAAEELVPLARILDDVYGWSG